MAGQKAVSRYKICIVTEAAGLAGSWALGRALGAGRWVGCVGRAGGVRGARRRSRRGARDAQIGPRRAACAHLGVLLGQQPMHLVHPACFSTQYYF